MAGKIHIEIGSLVFNASLLDNPTVSAFSALLPLRLQMSELNGNEKYADLPTTLPTAAITPSTIEVGDLMLYGSRTLVLWYENYTTSYTYTKIGSIDDTHGLAAAVGGGGVNVLFTRANTPAVANSSGTEAPLSSATASRAHTPASPNKKLWLLTGILGVMLVLSS